MAVPTDNNLLVKEYYNLEIEIEKMWHLKTTTMPVIVGALGMIKKGTDKHINKIACSSSLCEMQKITLSQNCSSPSENTINVTEKSYPKETAKNINT